MAGKPSFRHRASAGKLTKDGRDSAQTKDGALAPDSGAAATTHPPSPEGFGGQAKHPPSPCGLRRPSEEPPTLSGQASTAAQPQNGPSPLVSIITVVRNAAADLEKTILSVASQAYPSIEYIIIDGASTDGTLDVIRRHEPWVNRWISEPDAGIYDAMNKGSGLASGEWILFMNAGDLFAGPSALSGLAEALQSDADIILAGARKILVDDLETREFLVRPGNPEDLWRFMPTVHQSVLVRAAFQRDFAFDTTYHWCADQHLLLRLLNAGKSFFRTDHILSIFDCAGGNARHPMLFIRERFRLSKGAVPDWRRWKQFGGEWFHCRIWGTIVAPLKKILPSSCLLALRRIRGTAGVP
jgi:glycosyltransferase involved in cell wall biosynthesis